MNLRYAVTAFQNAVRQTHPALLRHLVQVDPPPRLFHYTTQAGLEGILRSDKLWASHYTALTGDANEGEYAQQLLAEGFGQSFDGDFPEPPRAVADWVARIRGQVLSTDDGGRPDAHVLCLTEHEDYPNQWNVYGASGGGFALGLDTSRFKFEPNVEMERVVYDAAEQAATFEDLVTVAGMSISTVRGVDLNDPDVTWKLTAAGTGAVRGCVAVAASVFKSPAFRDEAEWRVIVVSGNSAHVPYPRRTADALIRRVGGRDVSYFEVPLRPGKLPLVSIDLGPGLDFATEAPRVRQLLDENGYDAGAIAVRPSRHVLP